MNQFIVVVPRGSEYSCFYSEAIPVRSDSIHKLESELEERIFVYLNKRNEAEISHDYEGLEELKIAEINDSYFNLEHFVNSFSRHSHKKSTPSNPHGLPYFSVKPEIFILDEWLSTQGHKNQRREYK